MLSRLVTGLCVTVALATWTPAIVRAGEFTCTPSAIHAKAAYVVNVWNWLNSSASDNASADVFTAKLAKIWDGNGDCDGDEDMSNFSRQTQMDLLRTHFYGDMMTVAFSIGAKDYSRARQHMDDWLQADALIRNDKTSVDRALVADDQSNRGKMLSFDKQLSSLGYRTKPRP